MRRRVGTTLASLALLAAGCCPAPTARPADDRHAAAYEARVSVVTDGEAAADGAWTARTLEDGTPLLLRLGEGVVVAPRARLYLVGRWLGENTLSVTSVHPIADTKDAPPVEPAASGGAPR